jgi:hypothetical protein
MSYIGSTPTTQSFISGTDYFNGNGSTTAFTLSRTVASVNDIQAVVNNVVQVPNDAYNISGTTITFTSAPSSGTGNVYVRYMSTTTQSITPSQNTVSYATWNSDLRNQTFAFKNRIINGDMAIDQRNNGAAVTVNTAAAFYATDRFRVSATSSSGVFSAQQITDAPAGFANSLRVTVTTTDSSLAATDLYYCAQAIEGFNVADLGFGTVNAQTVTVSFWVKSSVTGSFGGVLANGSSWDRSYPFSYTIAAANTWEYKTVTIPGDTTGTWVRDSNVGMRLVFGLGVGSTFSGTAGAWSASQLLSSTGATNLMATSGATWQVTGVQLEKGFTATNFDVLPYGTELQLCQRYYQVGLACQMTGASASTALNARVQLFQPMRAVPSLGKTATTVRVGDMVSAGFTSTSSPSIESTYTGNELNVAFGLGGFTGLTSYRSYRHEPTAGDALFTMSAEL